MVEFLILDHVFEHSIIYFQRISQPRKKFNFSERFGERTFTVYITSLLSCWPKIQPATLFKKKEKENRGEVSLFIFLPFSFSLVQWCTRRLDREGKEWVRQRERIKGSQAKWLQTWQQGEHNVDSQASHIHGFGQGILTAEDSQQLNAKHLQYRQNVSLWWPGSTWPRWSDEPS